MIQQIASYLWEMTPWILACVLVANWLNRRARMAHLRANYATIVAQNERLASVNRAQADSIETLQALTRGEVVEQTARYLAGEIGTWPRYRELLAKFGGWNGKES